MKTITLLLLVLTSIVAKPVMAGEEQEISPGIKIYPPAGDIKGKLVFLRGHIPDPKSRDLPTADVLSFDLSTKTTSVLWTAPRAGQLTVSQDGKWVGLVLQDAAMLAGAEMILWSGEHKDVRYLHFSSPEVQAVIIEEHVFALVGLVGNRRIEDYDIQTGQKARISLMTESDVKADYTFVREKISDPCRFYFGYEPGGAGPIDLPVGGLYAYEVSTKKTEKIGRRMALSERSLTGELICWEPSGRGWALMAYRQPDSDREKRVLCRFSGDAFNFKQASPCLRYALIEKTSISSKGQERLYYLCDLQSGDNTLFLDARPAAKDTGTFIGEIHWVR